MLFFALGRYNPIVAFVVNRVPAIRIVRFPEKLALPMTVAIIVLVAGYYERSRYKRVWVFITLIPLLYVAVRALPIDWFSYYGTSMHAPLRTYISPTISAGKMPARVEYRLRALADEPLFGATEGLRYVINPSVEGMHSLRTRMVVERFQRGVRQPYLRIAQAFPSAFFWLLRRNLVILVFQFGSDPCVPSSLGDSIAKRLVDSSPKFKLTHLRLLALGNN